MDEGLEFELGGDLDLFRVPSRNEGEKHGYRDDDQQSDQELALLH